MTDHSIRQKGKHSVFQFRAVVYFENGTTRTLTSPEDTQPNYYTSQNFQETVHRELVKPAKSFGVEVDRIEYYLEETVTVTFQQTGTRTALQSTWKPPREDTNA